MTDELKSQIQKAMRQDAGNPYFVRKVLNRLPQKRAKKSYNWIINLGYAAAAIVLIILWLHFLMNDPMHPENRSYPIMLYAMTLTYIGALLTGPIQKLLHP